MNLTGKFERWFWKHRERFAKAAMVYLIVGWGLVLVVLVLSLIL